MLALSPPTFSSFGWGLEADPISQGQQEINNYNYCNYLYGERTETTSESHLQFPNPTPSEPQGDPGPDISSDVNMVKKLNHNASERDRRKKINHLYSSLRSLLPATEHTKKLSIPSTVSRVLKYIPEIQRQVEGLVRKKEELMSRMSSNHHHHHDVHQQKHVKTTPESSLSSVSACRLSDREVAVQISTYSFNRYPISGIFDHLEDDGLSILNATSFQSFEGRVFHTLHLQVERSDMECDVLSEKIMSLFERMI